MRRVIPGNMKDEEVRVATESIVDTKVVNQTIPDIKVDVITIHDVSKEITGTNEVEGLLLLKAVIENTAIECKSINKLKIV